MWEYMKERILRNAKYIIENNATVRACAQYFGFSKSTVHKDISERLQEIDLDLWMQARKVLDQNLAERHIRGGNATKQKYERERREKPSKKIETDPEI